MRSSSEPRLDVISLGTLARNLLWNEPADVRTPHATTSLIRAGGVTVVVDPGLPPQILQARFAERTRVKPGEVDVVFLTTLKPSHREGLDLFPDAKKLAHEPELLAVLAHLKQIAEHAADAGEDVPAPVANELRRLATLRPAEDALAEGVDLFPLPGATPGTCGLLVQERARSTLVTGPAVATRDHLLAGQVLPDAHSVEAAQASLAEVFEIADIIVPGYDNAFANPSPSGRGVYE